VFLTACTAQQEALSFEGGLSLYADSLEKVMKGGRFQGSYADLTLALRDQIKSDAGQGLLDLHTPQYYPLGDQSGTLPDKRPAFQP
jgi:hypothetical protein